jgi:hypothetical protein
LFGTAKPDHPYRRKREEKLLREVFEEENGAFHTEFHTGGFIRLSERRWHSVADTPAPPRETVLLLVTH